MWASYKGNEMVVQEYLERGADPNVKAEVLKYLGPPLKERADIIFGADPLRTVLALA